MKTLIITAVLTVGLALSGCVPAIIGAAAYSGGKRTQARQQFVSELQKTNLERERAGLEPLDYCTEAKRAGIKDKQCKTPKTKAN